MPSPFLMQTITLTKADIDRALTRIAHEILEKNRGADDLALVGIRTRGVFIAERLFKKIESIEGKKVDKGFLDITLYRDDLNSERVKPVIKSTDIPFPVEGKNIILCDDVLYTGRTIRSAIDELIDFGRPASVQLAVLIDRGHRELPIRADFVGKNIPTSKEMRIQVELAEQDSEDRVLIVDNGK